MSLRSEMLSAANPGALILYGGTVKECSTIKAAAAIVKPPIPLANPAKTITEICNGTQDAIRGEQLRIPICAEAVRGT